MIARSWSQPVLVALLLLCMVGAVSAAYLFPLPSFIKTRGSEPPHIATLDLELEELTCRGRANLLVWFLERDDLGPPLRFFRLEAWPGLGWSAVRIRFDPTESSAEFLKRAITEPYFALDAEPGSGAWRESPFRIRGYDPLAVSAAAVDAGI